MKLAAVALSFSLFGWLVPSCGASRQAPAVSSPAIPVELAPPALVTPAKPGETATETQLREARDALAVLAGDTARWQARVAILTTERDLERREAFLALLRTSCLWVAALALLGALACGVLAFVSPIAKPTLAKLAAGCGALVIMATGCAWLVPWLPLAGVVSVVAAVAAGLVFVVWKLVEWWPRFAHGALGMTEGYLEAARIAASSAPLVASALDSDNRANQILAGGLPAFEEGTKLLEAARRRRAARTAKPLPGGALP